MKYTKEQLLKLIGKLSGYGVSNTSVTVTYNPKPLYSVFGENEGYDDTDWGYSVSTKLCSTDKIMVDAQAKELEDALLALAKAIIDKQRDISSRYKVDAERSALIMNQFLEGKHE